MVDLLLKNAIIVLGDGVTPKRKGDIAIKDGNILSLTDTYDGEAKETLDLEGKIACPAFIDMHTHSDIAPLVDYAAQSKLYQGVGFELCGNCGISMLPSTEETLPDINRYFFSELEQPAHGFVITQQNMIQYADSITKNGSAIHYGMLVGHGTLRGCVMGFENRDPTAQELAQLKERLALELVNGAFGLSLGLIYPPSAYAKIDELVELAKVVRKYNGILAVHLRSETSGVFAAVEEMIEVAKRSGVHLHISHFKLMGKAQWGRSEELLQLLRDAREQGVTVTCDQYPYAASSTSMTAMLPHWAHDGGVEKLVERVEHPTAQLLAETAEQLEARGGAERVLISTTGGRRPEYEGNTLATLSQQLGICPVDTIMKVLCECQGVVACVYFSMHEQDVYNIMKEHTIAVASDGYSMSYDRSITTSTPHPRSFGTFPRFLQTVREQQLLSVEEAIAKMTSLPANILGLVGRGVLKEGNLADITVFDWDNVRDLSTFENSVVAPAGIEHVILEGKFALYHGVQTDARAGRVLLHK